MGNNVESASVGASPKSRTNQNEWLILLVLAGAQFAHILDFVIMMPLGPQLMRVLQISPDQFAFLVSSYTFSAAICGLAGVFIIDRFDRKSVLLTLYAGFVVGTAVCGLSETYEGLLVGRAIAGAFGGVMGAIVFSIIGDTFVEARRGAATGTVISAFSVASVVGVPIGLWSAHVSWRVPFLGLAAIGLVMMLMASRILPSMRSHLQVRVPFSFSEYSRYMLFDQNRWVAYGLIVSLMFAAFSVIPFLATYLVRNVGLSEGHLPYVYLTGGLFTLVTSRLIGKLADRYGKQKVFTYMASLSLLALLLLTNLPKVSVVAAILATTFFTVVISGRAVPAMSLITSSVESHRRGSFMSFTTAIQQGASGLASLTGGWILTTGARGELIHYDWVGYFAMIATVAAIYLANRLKVIGAS